MCIKIQDDLILTLWKTDHYAKNMVTKFSRYVFQRNEVVVDEDVDGNWEQIRKAINNVATMVLGKKN